MKLGAVILAAGFGTRLAPLTDNLPKPLIEVGAKPVASHLLDCLVPLQDLEHVIVVANGRDPQRWATWQSQLPERPIITIVSNGVTTNDERKGAVADLQLGISSLNEVDWYIVLAGDNLLEEALQPHVDTAVGTGRPLVLCRDLGEGVPSARFGEITVDDRSVITRFREKPIDPESPLAATCSYVLPGRGETATALADYLTFGDADSPGAFIAWWAAQRPICARPLTGRYFDIGNHETLAEARAAYKPNPERP